MRLILISIFCLMALLTTAGTVVCALFTSTFAGAFSVLVLACLTGVFAMVAYYLFTDFAKATLKIEP